MWQITSSMGCKSELTSPTDLIRYDHLCWRLCIRILYVDWCWEVATCAKLSICAFHCSTFFFTNAQLRRLLSVPPAEESSVYQICFDPDLRQRISGKIPMTYVAMVRGRPVWCLPWKRLSEYIGQDLLCRC